LAQVASSFVAALGTERSSRVQDLRALSGSHSLLF